MKGGAVFMLLACVLVIVLAGLWRGYAAGQQPPPELAEPEHDEHMYLSVHTPLCQSSIEIQPDTKRGRLILVADVCVDDELERWIGHVPMARMEP